MKIAYIILVHRYPEQAIRLIHALNTQDSYFLIHLDKKAPDEIKEKIMQACWKTAKIKFTIRHTCYWAGFGIVKASLAGLEEAVENYKDVDYVALLSGQDYPIKTNDQIQRFLHDNNGTSFIHHTPFPRQDWADHNYGWDRINRWHFISDKKHIVFPPAINFTYQKSLILENAFYQNSPSNVKYQTA